MTDRQFAAKLDGKLSKWIEIQNDLRKNQRAIDRLMHKRLALLELENKALNDYHHRG